MNNKKRLLDSKLVLEYQSGNIYAFNLLVKNWHKTFCEKAFWLVKDADVAKDIAQDSWKTIIERISHLKNPESFGSWALRIVYTKSLDWLNTNKQNYRCLQYLEHNQKTINDEVISDNEKLKKNLLVAIKKLPETQQTVIRLFYLEDYSLKQISDILKISIGTAKSRLFHAREKLKQNLKNRNYEN
ncbi:RNA polymerase sigma factor [Litoribaculum gwangyangense]|uniref:Sigma-70 family RNA polymerase sigma factor n=1 Tax=Litoribaculum gwangyangense TaxID=1130722 RepID=A0ABP9CG61_9FLAO